MIPTFSTCLIRLRNIGQWHLFNARNITYENRIYIPLYIYIVYELRCTVSLPSSSPSTNQFEACLIPWSTAFLENRIRTFWANKEILCLLIELEVLFKCSLIPIVSRINSIHTFTASLFRIRSAIIHQSKPAFPAPFFFCSGICIFHSTHECYVLHWALHLRFDQSKPAIQKSGTPLCHGGWILRSQFRFQLMSLECFINIIIPTAPRPWGRLSLWQKWVPKIFPEG